MNSMAELLRRRVKPRSGLSAVGMVNRLRRFGQRRVGRGHSTGGPAHFAGRVFAARVGPPARALAPLVVLAALIAVLAGLYPDTSRAQSTVTLISNMGKSNFGSNAAMTAQPFTTGSVGPLYVIKSVDVRLDHSGSFRNIRLRIFTVDENGLPVRELYTLNPPRHLRINAVNTFEAPADARLEKDTTYAIVVTGSTVESMPGRGVYHTSSGAEDSGGATGWSIADHQYARSTLREDWRLDEGEVLKMTIKGHAYTLSNDGTLKSLMLEDASDDSPIGLYPGYTSFTYSATTAHDVDTITFKATTNNRYATVTYHDPSTYNEEDWRGAVIPDADPEKDGHQIAISTGANEFRVVGTAENGNRPAPHFVRVWRELYGPTPSALVSNIERARQGGTRVGNIHQGAVSPAEVWSVAQQFRTGDNASGYTFTSIVAGMMNVGGSSVPKVSIYTHSPDGPDTSLYVLTNPTTFDSLATNTFTAPTDATLAANTRYWIVFENENTNVGYNNQYYVSATVFDEEDPGAASGWNIGNGHLLSVDGGSWTSTYTYPWSLMVAVVGASAPQEQQQRRLALAPLTAEFRDLPTSHDGVNAYTLRVAFSEDVEIPPDDLRDHALSAQGGTVRCVKRVDEAMDLFEVDVFPDGDGAVTVTLGPTPTDCTARGAVCTANGVALSSQISARVSGPGPVTNSAATGAPTISGAARVGETLTAGTSGIADADGLANVSYSYQWMRNDGTDDLDIPDATGSAYTLQDADLGSTIKVRVSFTDDGGNAETLTSAATVTVAARPNSAATGAPSISGAARVGQTLTAGTSGITDADGLASVSYAYQWIRQDGGTDSEVSGATSSTYTLVAADQGKTIRVRVSFTDDGGNAETLTSAATATVALPLLTVVMENPAESHNGSTGFTFDIRFSEDFNLGHRTLKNDAFDVTAGAIVKAQRRDGSSNAFWRITVRPRSDRDVTIVLPVTTDCEARGAICTGDGRKLSNSLEFTVSGPE